ncbi:extensin-like [Homo sapiens]|uniref:extensin-like n=1 Tax=Homo sapiens TaxID=9606 RepID=UPI001FB06CD6|nr:extensin-like [Homo sapiens]
MRKELPVDKGETEKFTSQDFLSKNKNMTFSHQFSTVKKKLKKRYLGNNIWVLSCTESSQLTSFFVFGCTFPITSHSSNAKLCWPPTSFLLFCPCPAAAFCGFPPRPPRLFASAAAAFCGFSPPPPRLFAPFRARRRRWFLPPRLFAPAAAAFCSFLPPPPWLFVFCPRSRCFLPPLSGFLSPRLFTPVSAAFCRPSFLSPPPRLFAAFCPRRRRGFLPPAAAVFLPPPPRLFAAAAFCSFLPPAAAALSPRRLGFLWFFAPAPAAFCPRGFFPPPPRLFAAFCPRSRAFCSFLPQPPCLFAPAAAAFCPRRRGSEGGSGRLGCQLYWRPGKGTAEGRSWSSSPVSGVPCLGARAPGSPPWPLWPA